ncbi:MAG: hypothetical protein GXP31_18220 [Kiritimatiellaeota bacterium]|nr:hypothetical protein [Kiritimatiellota bacterium]
MSACNRITALILGVSLWLVVSTPPALGQNTDLGKVLSQLREMRAQLAKQDAQIRQLKAKLQELENDRQQVVEQVVEDKLKKVGTSPLRLGNGNIDSLKLQGDLRVRYERRSKDTGAVANKKENRDRMRSRFRLGFVWTNSTEDWEIGAGLATGGDDGRSTNDTWNEKKLFETGDIRLDYAYAKHKWDNLAITLGQQKNPFVTSYILWDSDLRPTGLTAQLRADNVFATLGYYNVLWGANLKGNADDYSVEMFAGQIGVKYETEDGIGFLAAAGTYLFTDSFREATAGGTDPYKYSSGLYNVDSSYDVQLGDVYAQVTGKVGSANVKAYGHAVKNFGADGAKSQQGGTIDPSDNDLAWLLGFALKYDRIKLGYSYARIEADSVFGPMKDSDFGETAGLVDTNLEGHKLGLSYAVTPHFSLGLTTMLVQEIEGDKDAKLYQFDAVYKF